jgi:hypothetical protein
MKQKNIIINICIILVILSTLFIGGCMNNNNIRQPARRITGNDGLTFKIEGKNKIELFGNFPATEIYQINIENKGKYNIKNDEFFAEIVLKDGLRENQENKQNIILNSLSDFNIYNINTLEGLSQIRLKGDSITKMLNIETNVPSGQGITTGFTTKACYKYQTIFSETVCINSIKKNKEDNCAKSSYSFASGQGAPIKISKVEIVDKLIENNLVTPRIILTIENTKKQITSLPETFSSPCKSQENINKIKLVNAQLGQQMLSCNVENGIIDLSKNEQTVVCDLDRNPNIEFGDSFDTILHIILEYGYSNIETFNIDIVRK